VFVTAGYQTLRMLQTRLGQFKAASTANVAGSAVMGLLQVLAGIVGLGSGGLTAAYSLGRLVTDVQMARQAGFAAVGRMRWWLVAKWRRMPTWLLVPALLNAVSVGAVAPLIQVWYGKEVAGQMGLSQRLLMAPAALLGQAVAGVFFARFAVMVREGASTTASVTRVARALVAVALPVFVPFILLGPEIFSLLVGPDWALAGTVSGLLAPWLMVNFVSSPLSGYATVENRLPRLFVLSLIEAGLRIPALATGLVIGDVRSAIALYSLSGLLISGYWVGWVARLARASWMTVFGLAVPVIVVLASALSLAAVRSALSANLYLAVSVTVAILVAIGSGLAVVRTIRRGADAT
jgi:O-antigen/teichoic acid export membrane protein